MGKESLIKKAKEKYKNFEGNETSLGLHTPMTDDDYTAYIDNIIKLAEILTNRDTLMSDNTETSSCKVKANPKNIVFPARWYR